MDLENMTDEQIIMGLMRGEKASFKAGYSAEAAVHTVFDLRYSKGVDLTLERQAELAAFARGFAHGMHEDSAQTNPVSV